ncbi:hypothetical protein L198_07585 [Cryptococcus wingfieldii CBS 7118]|uniref:Uncharacterized protein n=1 Tax=Cryptococcus wingfieldii CBS 7118 TaxID=1295528 RepID=A0A1E3IBV9_9TREE|nr:hypothetical protein L198_07585 [Cryptococcus wingfieldii CBS 7118]ODN85261.1 hypothetical protein L198_07585 [Cryptococcus wingfieldii CBS 7118]
MVVKQYKTAAPALLFLDQGDNHMSPGPYTLDPAQKAATLFQAVTKCQAAGAEALAFKSRQEATIYLHQLVAEYLDQLPFGMGYVKGQLQSGLDQDDRYQAEWVRSRRVRLLSSSTFGCNDDVPLSSRTRSRNGSYHNIRAVVKETEAFGIINNILAAPRRSVTASKPCVVFATGRRKQLDAADRVGGAWVIDFVTKRHRFRLPLQTHRPLLGRGTRHCTMRQPAMVFCASKNFASAPFSTVSESFKDDLEPVSGYACDWCDSAPEHRLAFLPSVSRARTSILRPKEGVGKRTQVAEYCSAFDYPAGPEKASTPFVKVSKIQVSLSA